jgi:hypothetical protein
MTTFKVWKDYPLTQHFAAGHHAPSGLGKEAIDILADNLVFPRDQPLWARAEAVLQATGKTPVQIFMRAWHSADASVKIDCDLAACNDLDDKLGLGSPVLVELAESFY